MIVYVKLVEAFFHLSKQTMRNSEKKKSKGHFRVQEQMSSTEKISLEHSSSGAEDSGVTQEPRIRTLKSVDLFEGAKELGIEHQGLFYRLKITRQGKLVLNK